MSHMESKSNGRKSSDSAINVRQGMDGGKGPDPETYPMRMEYLLGLPSGTRSSIWPAIYLMAKRGSRMPSRHGHGRFVCWENGAERDERYNKVAHKILGRA
jgi:hypothetical protein